MGQELLEQAQGGPHGVLQNDDEPKQKAAPRQGPPRPQRNNKRSQKKAPNKHCTGKDVIITMEVDTNGRVDILGIKEKKIIISKLIVFYDSQRLGLTPFEWCF